MADMHPGAEPAEPILLRVRDLRVRFEARPADIYAVNGISYDLRRGESLAIVGESGSGKTVGVQALMGLLASPPAHISGAVEFEGRDLLAMAPDDLRRVRGRRIAMISQDPMTSLNPVLSIKRQMTEAARTHLTIGRREATRRAMELLDRVGIPDSARRLHDHPHQFSGGQRQRIGIAMALMCEPDLLIADEPTTALDVTIQAQIMDLVSGLQHEFELAVIWITHDLGVAANLVDRVAVMYAGRIVEIGPTSTLFADPRHAYTAGLLRSLPRSGDAGPLTAIRGQPPDLSALGDGCAFAPRCDYVVSRCHTDMPLLEDRDAHRAACYRTAAVVEDNP